MYNCIAHITFLGCPRHIQEVVKAIPPLAGFSHEFSETFAPGPGARLVLAGPGADLRNLPEQAQIILLRESGTAVAPELLGRLADIWQLPASDAELRFHFCNWQKNLKTKMDLGEKSQFLECLMETSPNLVWFKDRNGIHELVNRSFCETVNKTRDQIQGKAHAYIWDVDQEDPACIESERVVMESGSTHTSEEQIETGAGHKVLTVFKSPLRNDEGEVMGTLGIGMDITQEREYYEKLIQNNADLESFFTTMDCGIVCHTMDGSHVLSVNNAALRLLGYATLEELDNNFETVARTVLDEDKQRLRKAINGLRKVGDSSSYEYRVRHEDGSIRHIIGNARIVEKDSQLVCQRFLLDCTDQKMAEEKEKREREQRQLQLVRALSVDFQLVYVHEPESADGTVLQLLDYPDQELKRIFESDASLEQKITAYAAACVHPDDRESFKRELASERLRTRLATEPIVYFNYRALNGEESHYFQMKAARVGAADGPYGIVVGLQSVDSRTREDMEQKCILAEALKQAQNASKAKSAFLSNMSHDIRTPLNAILGYTSLALANQDKKAAVSGYLDRILDSGNHLISLINDILDMSHIESGKIQLEETPYSLKALIREIWNIVQPAADRKEQTLKLEISETRTDSIYCDKLRLKQVLLNLLSNSIKYTDNGGEISMTVRELPSAMPDQALFEFVVRDNGIGMTQEFLERIFEPFERASNAIIQNIQGTGLGMAIAKSIVEMMKGEIRVESRLGEGTEFHLQLAFRLAQPEELAAEAQEGVQAGTAAKKGVRILLAEDNEMNQEIAHEFLTAEGYEVDIAENGSVAVEKLRNAPAGHYSLILMDVQMPVLDGYAATSQIRALPDNERAAIPIVAMTANSFEEDRQQALSCGMNAHIAKPIDFKALFRTMAGLLAER
ncbi:MAG: response regulator [Desulfovibrio sp.]|nr:response regulator [Desulfovibrio sp.]